MSGVKKVSLPSPPVAETKPVATRPTDVKFPSVKDLKAKFNSGDAKDSQQIIISKKEQQIRHSYARGNSKLEITGPTTTDNKRNSKTPTTPTTPTTLKVKTTSNSIFETNGTSKQNGGSPATTPTTPTKSFQMQQRSSVILHVQAGERVSSQQETVEVRKKVISDVSSTDSVRRLTSQFNDMRNQTTIVTKTSTVEIPKKITPEVEKKTFEEERENLSVAAEIVENVVEERISDQEDDRDDDLANGRRMSTPSAEFLHSMNDREEYNYESVEHQRQEDNDIEDLQIQLNDDQNDHHSVSEQFEEYQFQDSPSEHEEHHENTFEQNEEHAEQHEDNYEYNEHHEEYNEHHEEHNEHHEEHNEHHEEHNEHHENASEHDEPYEEHNENHEEQQDDAYEHYEHQENASEQHDIYSEIGHNDSENNFESESASELKEEVIEEIIENSIHEHLKENEEEQED